jgi:hypothetical protein
MRIASSVSSLSWIPSEAVTGPANKAVFGSGFTHYDDPPPDTIADFEALRNSDRFRFANRLHAWIDVEDGRIVGSGYGDASGGMMGTTTVRVVTKEATFAAPAMPDIQSEPEQGDGWVRFEQTTGGRTAVPAPRRVNHPPFVQFRAPLVWTTLTLTLHADGRCERELTGASLFPRHWVYDDRGELCAKAGLADFKQWWRKAFGRHTPWGSQNSKAFVSAVESALERELATRIMRGGEKPKIRSLKPGALLTEQGAAGNEVFLVLDGIVVVEVHGEPVAEYGPGAILGERAALEGGPRTATLRAVTKVRVAGVGADQLERSALEEIAQGHRREDARQS